MNDRSGDEEKLLAEALRAKASQGGGVGTAGTVPVSESGTVEAEEPAKVTSGWILLLAVLLGLATGAVIGLLTIL